MISIKFKYLVAGEVPNGFLGADHRTSVRMHPVGRGKQILGGPARWRVFASLDLLANGFDLVRELVRMEAGVADRIAQDVEANPCELARQHHVVDGVIE